jgi:hypothetical protein
MMLADEEARRYRLYVEADPGPRPPATRLADEVDTRLAAYNVEYRAKRESGRLAPIESRWLHAGAGEAYKQHCVLKGQREGQFKSVALATVRGFGFDLESLVERD